jgi:uncharacterized protein involved in exopolysaccharide biosynthesis
MLDRLSVPRRALDFEDYIDILRRNLGWVLGPILLGLVVSTVIAYSMEDTYVSSALLRVVPQQISQKLANYRQQHIGQLPDDMQLNISQMNALESQLGSLNAALTNNHEQHMMLESNLGIAQDRLKSIQSPAEQRHDQHLADMDQQIQHLQAEIASMRNQYTESYPDLQTAEQQLALLKKRREDYAGKKASDYSVDNAAVSRNRQSALAQVKTIETRLKANDINKNDIEEKIQKTRDALGAYQGRLAQIPAGEKEYANLMQQLKLDQEHYSDLQHKLDLAEASSALQQRNQGQSLELIDSASLPDKPTEPNREKIIPIGAVAGLFIGLLLVAIREIKDTSLKNLKDARLYTQLPILGSIPLLENDLVVQRRKQIMWVGWATATLACIAIIAGSVAHYYLSKA